jgi:hypothetical protein
MCSDAPDPDPLIGQAAMDNVALSREMIEYFRAKDAKNEPRQEKMDALTTDLIKQQMGTSAFNDQQARQQWDRYQASGIPAEDAMYADAANFDTQEARDKAAGAAATDVDVSLAMAQDARRRQLARSGVNPADGRALALEQDASTQGALAKASAMNGARDAREMQGVMLKKDAAAFGRGAIGSAAQTFGVASVAGGQASGAAAAGMQTANANTGVMGSGFTGAGGLNSSGAGIAQSSYNSALEANKSGVGGLLAGVGGIASGLGAMGVTFSDKNMKENRAPVDGEAALEGIKKTPIESWNYKEGTPADDGGQPHIGGMAQDLQKNLGDDVAPGGKLLDPVSAIGTTMAAVQTLAKKVEKMESRMASKGVKHV